MFKKIVIIVFSVLLFSCGLCACSNELEIPKNYRPIPDSDAFDVTLQYEPTVKAGENFFIIVNSKNVSSKDLYNEVCSSLYRIGAKITVYTEINGEKFYLQDEFETLTEDIKIEKISKGETVSHAWRFDGTLDAARHGTEMVENIIQRKAAPKVSYNILISTGQEIKEAFEII